MEKKILIAVEDSVHSKKAVEYAAKMKSIIPDLTYTLFNVQPTISEYLRHDAATDAQATSALNDLVAKNEAASMKILNDLKAAMVAKGIDGASIELVSRPRVMGAAKDILNYAKQRLHDAVVLGRRGVSRLEETFMGSVSNMVLEHANIIPVWAISGEVNPSKILVAVDGSESSLNAVDHISYMMKDSPNARFTLLHITPTLRDYCTIDFDEEGEIVDDAIAHGAKKCVDGFYVHAKQRFKEAGIAEDRITVKEVKSTVNIGKTIVDEVKKGNFGVVVIGRKGANESFFIGSVSRYVIHKAPNCAVWLVP